MAIYFVDNGIDGRDEKAVSEACAGVDVRIAYEDGAQQVILNGVNVTARLRHEEVGRMASAVAVYAAVRSKLVELQRQLAAGTDVIMDGRDIGTCVLPDATVKIYLTASVDARAKRRYDELVEKGEKQEMDVIKADIEKRDYNDMHRDISPLKQADDAVLLDSSDMNIEEVTDAIMKIFNDARV
jgi:cytidylate kinase